MQPRLEPNVASYVVVGGRAMDWAIDAELVREIVLESDWSGSAPFDMAALWGDAGADEAQASRVIVVHTQNGLRGIRATRIAYRSLDRTLLYPLPALMARAPAAAFVTGVVFDDAHPALVVVNPEGLSYDTVR